MNRKGHGADPAGLRWTRSSPLPRALLAIAAGADLAHLTLPRNGGALRRTRPDRAMARDRGGSRRDTLAKYAVAFFRCRAPSAAWPVPPSDGRSPSARADRLAGKRAQSRRRGERLYGEYF